METHSNARIGSPPNTFFAPAERDSLETLQSHAAFCLHNPITRAILESVDGYVIILNQNRQILAANPKVLEDLNVHDSECLLGQRPGEIFGCTHSTEEAGGCGTTKFCSSCGAVISILTSQILNQPSSNECLMTVESNGRFEAHEFSIRSTPISIEDNQFTIFVVHDVSSVKRRDVLEKVFIHDLNNIVTGLQGWSEVLVRRPQDATDIANKIVKLSTHLTLELQNQRMLVQAERGELAVTLSSVSVESILGEILTNFSGYPDKLVERLDFCNSHNDVMLMTSPPLLSRVLANMVKNALEATQPGERVKVWFDIMDDFPVFFVHNPGLIPETVALQLFNRSFSTKSSNGRGLGTYSMKLLGEQYLGGKVGFSSTLEDGTIFYIQLPKST